jgi:hypothetical protein
MSDRGIGSARDMDSSPDTAENTLHMMLPEQPELDFDAFNARRR